MQLTVNQTIALLRAEIDKQDQGPHKGAALRHLRQFVPDLAALGIGNNVVFESKVEPSPSSGKPSRPLSKRRAGRKGAGTTRSSA